MYGRHGRRGTRWRAGMAAAGAAALLLTACSSDGDGGNGKSGGETSGGSGGIGQRPADVSSFWVNPDSTAARQLADYGDGEKENAELIRKIAEQPAAEWIRPEDPEEQARGYTEAAGEAERDAVLVLYNIPHRDCGLHSAGGAADGDEYRAFVDGVAKGIGDRPATVVLEPDAVLHMVDRCTDQKYHEERYALLGEAVDKLGALKNTKVYLDAGNAGWGDTEQIFEPLKRAGVERADGFSVNVSNFYTTEESIRYGKELSAKVGNKPFVIDTSRNGNGPYDGGDPAQKWCNPPGRALGETPTTDTGDEQVDAFLWIKRPGESDGECRGGPPAGQWWPDYALKLAKAAA
ncbi:glycoside hydrolase family 6 protein [Streptomyces sp. NPDC060194]|uniref:glycoside hydrolase family 6 protein n=1 Tax=Streptomyces sp. NPDC060194 TaxID=3347069 RepID=UPI00364B72FB